MDAVKHPGAQVMFDRLVETMIVQDFPFIDLPLVEAMVDDLIAASGGPDHLVDYAKDGTWICQHPIHERYAMEDGLFQCQFNLIIEMLLAGNVWEPGNRYRVWIGDDMSAQWEVAP